MTQPKSDVRAPMPDARRAALPTSSEKFTVGQLVRYKPGFGTYGYEDCLESDGQLSAVVVGHTPTRIRIELTGGHRLKAKRVAVDAASLRHEHG